jgi:hypothetical protein
MLGFEEAAFLCGGTVVLSLDGGASWRVDEPLEDVQELLGSGATIVVERAGGERLMRAYPALSAWGAVPIPRETPGATSAPAPPRAAPAEAVTPVMVREPATDAGSL